MSVDSATGFAEFLRRLPLLEPAQLTALTHELQARFPQPRALAGELIRRGWLTPYQVNQLFAGRGSSLLLGSYVVLDRLGEGGMGQVFKARSRNLGRVVALKVVHQDRAGHPSLARRFVREIEAIAKLNHPNIVHAYDAEEAGGCSFLVMEYVEGTDLERLVREQGALPVVAACSYAAQAALGLQHAHARGLVHRDVKPSNLLLARDGTIKVLDLGLARFRQALEEEQGRTAPAGHSATGPLTREGALMGTPDFMAPEQAEGAHAVDARADLYSLGCTLYFLLIGRPPFPGGTLIQKLRRHEREEPEPVEHQRPDVPAGLPPVLRRLMAKRPADRYPNAGEAAAALAVLARDETPPAPAPPLADTTVIPPTRLPSAADSAAVPVTRMPSSATAEGFSVGPTFPSPAAGRRERARRRRRLLLALAVLLAIVLPAALWFSRTGDQPAPEVRQPRSPEEELEALRRRLNARSPEAREALAQDVRAFRDCHPGTRLALAASTLLRLLPSPLDRLPPVPDAERFGWQPRHLVGVLGEHRQRHWGAARCVAFHPGGRLLASGGDDDRVRVWDTDTGHELVVLAGHTSYVFCVAFSPDGKTLASGSIDATVRLWAVTAEPLKIEERATLKGHQGQVTGVAFAPDGKTLASCSYDGTVRLWDLAGDAARERAVLRGHGDTVGAVAFSPDGKTLASGGHDTTVRVWDAEAGKERLTFRGHAISVACLAFSPDGKTVVSGGDGAPLKRWDPVSGKETSPPLPATPTLRAQALAFSPDGSVFVSGGFEEEVRVWDAARNVVQAVLPRGEPRTEDCYGVAFDAAGRRLAVAAGRGVVRVYDMRTRQESHPPAGPAGPIQSLALAPDDRTLATSPLDGGLRLWDLPTARVRDPWPVPPRAGYFSTLAFRPPEGATLATGCVYAVELLDPATGQVRQTLDDNGIANREGMNREWVRMLAWTPDGRALAAAYQTGFVARWEAGSPAPVGAVRAHTDYAYAVAFSPDGKTLASGGVDGAVHLWRDPGVPQGPGEVRKARHQVHCLAFAPDGQTLAAGTLGEVARWDAAGEQRAALTCSGWVEAVAFSPDGRTLTAADDTGLLIWWDPANGKKLGEWRAPGRFGRNTLAFASDSRHLIVGNPNGTVYVLRLAAAPDPDRASIWPRAPRSPVG